MKQEYFLKLKDPRWQRKRLEIMQRADFKCEDCGSGEKTLNVHHTYYVFGKNPWDYPSEALLCLCEECHEVRGSLEHDATLMLKQAMSALLNVGIHAFCKVFCDKQRAAEIMRKIGLTT